MAGESKEQAPSSSNNSNTSTNSPQVDTIVKCTLIDGEVVDVPLSVIRISHVISKMGKNLGQESNQEMEIPLPMDSRVFDKVIDWCKTHGDQPDPVVKADPMTNEREWWTLTEEDTNFLNVPIDDLADLMMAANFLDIKTLYHYSCQTFASHLKGKSPQEIRDLLGIEKDLTEKDEADIRKTCIFANF